MVDPTAPDLSAPQMLEGHPAYRPSSLPGGANSQMTSSSSQLEAEIPLPGWTDGLIAADSLEGNWILNGLNVPATSLPPACAAQPGSTDMLPCLDVTTPMPSRTWLEVPGFGPLGSGAAAQPSAFTPGGVPEITLTEPTPPPTTLNSFEADAAPNISSTCTFGPSEGMTSDKMEEFLIGCLDIAALELFGADMPEESIAASNALAQTGQPGIPQTTDTSQDQAAETILSQIAVPGPAITECASLQVPSTRAVQHPSRIVMERGPAGKARSEQKKRRRRHERNHGLAPAERSIERVHRQNAIAMAQLSRLKLYTSRAWDTGQPSRLPTVDTRNAYRSAHRADPSSRDKTFPAGVDARPVCNLRLQKRAFNPSQFPENFVDLTQDDH